MVISCFVPKLEIEERGVLMVMTETSSGSFSYLSIIKTWQNNIIGARMYGSMKLLLSCLKF
jgi:hypothetical protein